jgi:hypothetical protein
MFGLLYLKLFLLFLIYNLMSIAHNRFMFLYLLGQQFVEFKIIKFNFLKIESFSIIRRILSFLFLSLNPCQWHLWQLNMEIILN